MDEVKEHWVNCIRRLKMAGFDMAMIHGAHMNLFASFLTPLLNRRTDEYGGSPENRMRFPLEILEACRRGGREADSTSSCASAATSAYAGGVCLEDQIAFLNAGGPLHRPGRGVHRRLPRPITR